MSKKDKYKVAIVGATGAVGETLLSILAERKFPISELVPLASERLLAEGRLVRRLNAGAPIGQQYRVVHAERPRRACTAHEAFVDWLNKGSQLTFVYCPYGTEEFYCDIHVESLGKTEIEQGTKLTSTIVAVGQTPWYKPIAKIVNITPDAVESSTWDLEWDVVWANNNTAGETSVSAGGHLPSAIKAVISGPLYNPEILLLKDGNTVAKMALDDTTVLAGSVLAYSSLYTGAGVWIDGVSQIPALDLANQNFFRVPLGGEYTLRITSEQSVSITGTVSIYDYYRSV